MNQEGYPSYKIIYHVGPELTLKTKACAGILKLQDDALCISGESDLRIPFSSITSVDLFRMYGLGRMIKMVFNESTIFFTVVRLNLFGYFVIINFFKTGKLYKSLKNKN